MVVVVLVGEVTVEVEEGAGEDLIMEDNLIEMAVMMNMAEVHFVAEEDLEVGGEEEEEVVPIMMIMVR